MRSCEILQASHGLLQTDRQTDSIYEDLGRTGVQTQSKSQSVTFLLVGDTGPDSALKKGVGSHPRCRGVINITDPTDQRP